LKKKHHEENKRNQQAEIPVKSDINTLKKIEKSLNLPSSEKISFGLERKVI
jgi:hypothetical protein